MFRQAAKKIVLAIALMACVIVALAQAPQIVLRTTDGQDFNLAKDRGNIIVLSFSATWVPLTDRELRAFQILADRYSGRGVNFYWVSTNSAKKNEKNYASDAELEAFATKLELRLRVLRDPDQVAFRAFGLGLFPSVVIIDREGRVYCKVIGFDPEEIEYYDPEKIESYTTRVYGEVIHCLNQLLK
jgi:peroxiredoxin